MESALDDARADRPRRSSLPIVWKIATAIAFLLAVAVTVAVALADRRQQIEEARSEARHAARLIAAEIGGTLETVEVILQQAIGISGPPNQPISASREAWDELVALAGAASVTGCWHAMLRQT